MKFLQNITVSLGKMIGVIVILVLLGIFFTVYFLGYIPKQQSAFHGRAFRELEQIGTALKNKNEAYYGAISIFLKKKQAGTPLLHSFSFSPSPLPGPGSKDTLHAGQMVLEKNDQNGEWQIAYPVYSSKDSLITQMNTGLDSILRPLISTYKDIFSNYLLIRDRGQGSGARSPGRGDSAGKGVVVFNSGNLSVDYRISTDSLIQKNDGLNLITVHDAIVEGNPYKIFFYPFQLGKERIILTGMISLEAYMDGYKQIPFSLVMLVAVLVLLLFIHLPILKIFVLGRYERITDFNIRMIIGTYFTAAFLAFFLFSRIFLQHVQSVHNYGHLQDLSTQVQQTFQHEIDSICRQLKAWDTLQAVRNDKEGSVSRAMLPDSQLRRTGNAQADKALAEKARAENFRVDTLMYPRSYPYPDYVFWIDSAGTWTATWNTKKVFNKTTLLTVSDRRYFQDFLHYNILTLPGADPPDSFTIQPTLSKFDGEYTVTVVIPSSPTPAWKWKNAQFRQPRLIGLSTSMYSVCKPLLPAGYNFSIIDDDGDILYDSKPGRALLSTILKETEDPSAILGSIHHRNERYFASFMLRGQQRALLATPMKGFPYALLVYYDLSGSDDFQAHLIGLSAFFGGAVLILLILSALIKEWSDKKNGLLLTPTQHFEWLQPTALKERYYRHLIRGMLLLLGLFLSAWVFIENLPPQFEFSLFFISLVFPFYVALHYYLLREKQENGFALPHPNVLAFLSVTVAIINCYAFWSLRSSRAPLLITQLVLLAGILVSVFAFDPMKPRQAGNWLDHYVRAILIGIVLISIIPACSIFWLLFRQESTLAFNSSRLNYARAIDQRRITVNERIAEYKYDLADLGDSARHVADSENLHWLKFRHGVYLLSSDTIDTHIQWHERPSYSISPEYNRIHRYFFPEDSTALAWSDHPDSAADGSWYFLRGLHGKWRGPQLLYNNQRDGVEDNSLLLKTDSTASLTAFSLMMHESFSASPIYTLLYFSGLALILLLTLALTYALAKRIFLLDLLHETPAIPKFPDAPIISPDTPVALGSVDSPAPPGAPDTPFVPEPAVSPAPADEVETLFKTYAEDEGPRSMQDLCQDEMDLLPGILSTERTILEHCNRFDTLYRKIWDLLSPEEKFFLYDFATDGFANYKNGIILSRLIARRVLLVNHQHLQFMTLSFREWVLRQYGSPEIAAVMKKGQEEGSWQNMKMPLLLILAIPGIFIFITQDDIYQKIMGFVTAIGPLFHLLSSLVSKPEPKEPKGGKADSI
ncbi:MAG TPA: hypothetical protein VE035_02660 [Puia sp.]|nr:hypothetical protein [Puia sp.]